MDPVPHVAANPLARPLPATLGAGLEDAERPALASAVLPPLAKAWRSDEGYFPLDPRGLEATVLALQAEPVDVALLNSAAEAAVIYLWDLQQDARAALALGQAALERLEALDSSPGPVLAGKLVNAAERLGEVELQEQLLDATLRRDDLSDHQRGQFLALRANREMRRGDVQAAEESLNAALKYLNQVGDRRGAAVTKGKIADILQMRGDLDGALALFEERIKIADDMGDRRGAAVTKGKIADILQMRGDLDGALAMHRDRLTTAREMGDIDSVAHIQFSCARIRLERGEHESGGIQTIHEELAEAFGISLKIQRPDAIGPIGNLLGQILAMAGEHEEATKVLTASAEAFRTIGHEDQAAQSTQLIEMIRGMQE